MESESKEEENVVHILYEFPWGQDSVEVIRNHGSQFLESASPPIKELMSSGQNSKVMLFASVLFSHFLPSFSEITFFFLKISKKKYKIEM